MYPPTKCETLLHPHEIRLPVCLYVIQAKGGGFDFGEAAPLVFTWAEALEGGTALKVIVSASSPVRYRDFRGYHACAWKYTTASLRNQKNVLGSEESLPVYLNMRVICLQVPAAGHMHASARDILRIQKKSQRVSRTSNFPIPQHTIIEEAPRDTTRHV